MKRKRYIAIILIIFLLAILGILEMESEAKEEARGKLQQVVDDSYIENTLNIEALKDNIEKEINNSKVINKDTENFPVHTVVDGYEFKVEENGIAENNEGNVEEKNNLEDNKINNIEPVNEIKNETGDNNIKQEPVQEEKKETIVKYKNDEKIDKGITISTTEDGIVTINGKSTDKLFIKISNNIQISDKAKSFEDWKTEDGIIIEKDKQIKQKVTIFNNIVTKGQVNVVLRTEENEALGILKLVENQTEYNAILNKNIIANYIYIDKDVEINNIKFKVEITEEPNTVIESQEDLNTIKEVENNEL